MVNPLHERLLAKARRGNRPAVGGSTWRAVADDDEPADRLDHRPEGRQLDAGSSTFRHTMGAQAGPSRLPAINGQWPPSRGDAKRPRADDAPIDVDALAAEPRALGSGRVELATVNVVVKGIQHYPGASTVTPACIVKLKREPTNAYDANAIEVVNLAGARVGHLPRGVAAKLAPLVDAGDVKVRAKTGTWQMRPAYDLPLVLTLLGRPEMATDYRLRWAIPQPGRAYPQAVRAVIYVGRRP